MAAKVQAFLEANNLGQYFETLKRKASTIWTILFLHVQLGGVLLQNEAMKNQFHHTIK